jgi:hypothetical protein
MRKLCALLSLMFVLSFAVGVSGQDNRKRPDDRKGQRTNTTRSGNRGGNTGNRRHRRHRRRGNTGTRNRNRNR